MKQELGAVRSELSEIMKVLSTLKLSNEQSSPKGGSSRAYIVVNEGPKRSTLKFDDKGFPIPPSKGQLEGSNRRDKGFVNENSFEDYAQFEESDTLHHGNRSNHHGADYRILKLKMPLFDGEDSHGWIYKVESEARSPFRLWEGLKRRLLERFQLSQEGTLYEKFLVITQEGSACKYVSLFKTLAGQLVGIPEKVMEGTFIKGLRPELRGYNAGRNYSGSGSTRWPVNNPERKPMSATTCCLKPFKRLTDAEMVLLVGDEEEDEDSDPEHVHLDSVEVSLNSVMGFTTPRTMKIQGKLGDRDVVVLIDCGATHNFLSVELVNDLGLVVSGRRSVTIKGKTSLSRTLVSLKSMVRLLQKENKGFLVEMKQLDDTQAEATTTKTSFDIGGLLAKYENVFNLPSGLPPSRDHEHSIVLKDGTMPIGVRPYRYPHIQKNEIEKLVKEMLAAGVIQPSSSPLMCHCEVVNYVSSLNLYFADFTKDNTLTSSVPGQMGVL
ncbi:putative mitochondrial protein [Tanacetum coccineum]